MKFNIQLRLAGQESIPQTYALCKSDMMISGEEPGDIRYGNSISEDQFSGERFDCGSKIGFLQANIAFALQRDDLNQRLRDWLAEHTK